jgi:hypothetical protein
MSGLQRVLGLDGGRVRPEHGGEDALVDSVTPLLARSSEGLGLAAEVLLTPSKEAVEILEPVSMH